MHVFPYAFAYVSTGLYITPILTPVSPKQFLLWMFSYKPEYLWGQPNFLHSAQRVFP
jgi:hypothetical protein